MNDTPTYLNPPKPSGKELASKRLAAKLESNRAIPTIPREPSRQVRRAAARRAAKDLTKHRNETVLGKNRKR